VRRVRQGLVAVVVVALVARWLDRSLAPALGPLVVLAALLEVGDYLLLGHRSRFFR